MSLLGGGFSDAQKTDKLSNDYIVYTNCVPKLQSRFLSIASSPINSDSLFLEKISQKTPSPLMQMMVFEREISRFRRKH